MRIERYLREVEAEPAEVNPEDSVVTVEFKQEVRDFFGERYKVTIRGPGVAGGDEVRCDRWNDGAMCENIYRSLSIYAERREEGICIQLSGYTSAPGRHILAIAAISLLTGLNTFKLVEEPKIVESSKSICGGPDDLVSYFVRL